MNVEELQADNSQISKGEGNRCDYFLGEAKISHVKLACHV